jgi:putative membrane protein
MDPISDQQLVNEHLANDRTVLAWLSASSAIMAFGFVVIKFSLVATYFMPVGGLTPEKANSGYAVLGVALNVMGLITMGLSLQRYLETRRQLRKGCYAHSARSLIFTAGMIFMIGLILAISTAMASCHARPAKAQVSQQAPD